MASNLGSEEGRRWARPDASVTRSDAQPSTTRGDKPQRSMGSRILTFVVVIVLFAVIAALVLAVMVQQGLFTITAIDAANTAHLTGEEIAQLADVQTGTSLIAVDKGAIEANVKKNPWVKSVSISREFPSTLGVIVEERVPKAVVLMNSGDKAWLLSTDGYWLEPVGLDTANGKTAREAAVERAHQLNCLFIENVPDSMAPEAGYAATDEVLSDVDQYLREFSERFSSQIASF